MRDDYKYILNDSLPLLDEIFKEEINSKIQMDEDIINIIDNFNNDSLNLIEKNAIHQRILKNYYYIILSQN